MAEHMTVCGGHLTASFTPTNIFSHAKFGDVNYDNKEDCDWIIEAPAGDNVQLTFDNFQLEDVETKVRALEGIFREVAKREPSATESSGRLLRGFVARRLCMAPFHVLEGPFAAGYRCLFALLARRVDESHRRGIIWSARFYS